MLTQLQNEDYESLQWWDSRLLPWFRYLHYFHLVESTTGVSQKPVIDEPDEVYDVLAPAHDEGDVYDLYGSAYGSGAVMNMVLYIDQVLKDSDQGLFKELLGYGPETGRGLQIVVERTVDAARFMPQKISSVEATRREPYGSLSHEEQQLEDFGLIQMARKILSYRPNLQSEHEGLTPFMLLFQKRLLGDIDYRGISYNQFLIMKLLLNHGQDPNITILVEVGRSRNPGTAKALHLADYRLAKLLLDKSAEVNASCDLGFTPLDMVYGAMGSNEQMPYGGERDVYEWALLLIRNGGYLVGSRSN
ncbi:hypothetical protein FSARC_13487 [Fusarium sarcochroum]|uniref:Ankyrin repeat protein n=1 Tax=Fusarium sarcochroum TaxID=1208366 RepID=A0A8H4WT75_9HYPO|nr:hypothetical protein FSARC_13487 [Fusarium sarcochroum]